jgi:hypothetical protein
MSGKKFLSAIVLALILVTLVPPRAAAAGDDGEDDWIRTSGDILQIALPVIGGGATFFTNPDPDKKWDKEGTKQFAKAYGLAWGSTYFIKILAAKARPNGANRTSFPSGHTMSAFAGAAFIDGRFGRTYGIPAYALAVWTGYSRVHSGWHYRDDVIAGASIGMISNWLIVSPLPGKVQFLPTVNQNGYGFQVSIGGSGGEQPADELAEARPRGAAYRFGFGPAFVISNTAGSKGEGDNHFVLSDLEGFNDPTTTAVVTVDFPVGARGRLGVSYGPFEARDQGAFAYDVNFGGETFPAGTPLNSSWRFYDLSARYDYGLTNSERWGVNVGGGAGVMYSYATLATQDGTQSALVDDESFYPFLAGDVEYRFSPHWALGVNIAGMTIADDWILDAGGEVTWRPARAWDVALGYKYFSRKIETDTFYNKVNYNIPYLSITRFW